MNILIIGRGGREHAIAWKINQSAANHKIFVAPGNAGTSAIATNSDINELENEKRIAFAIENKIDLTIVGPESALMNGIVDDFERQHLKIFGPRLNAAIIEGSKEFTKKLMIQYNIPTAKYEAFNDFERADEYLQKQIFPIVIKADNLAAGKGVIIAQNYAEANRAIHTILIDKKFNSESLIIEEFLDGVEFSLMAFVKGNQVYPMEIAQDYKRAFDNHQGPNTGGMGAYSPVPSISATLIQEAIEQIMIPTAKAMVAENRTFCGVLYGGLIATKKGIKVIEFNARFGDPETEVILPRLKNDLVEIIFDLLDNRPIKLEWSAKKSVGVVLAAKGYPNEYQTGQPIDLNGIHSKVNILHMGTAYNTDKKLVNAGGRVLFVTALEDNFNIARDIAYQGVHQIKSDNLFFRNDIGKGLGDESF